jgi:hypothetical protein
MALLRVGGSTHRHSTCNIEDSSRSFGASAGGRRAHRSKFQLERIGWFRADAKPRWVARIILYSSGEALVQAIDGYLYTLWRVANRGLAIAARRTPKFSVTAKNLKRNETQRTGTIQVSFGARSPTTPRSSATQFGRRSTYSCDRAALSSRR